MLSMSYAEATYSILSSTEAVITVSYPSGGFGMERVSVRRGFSVYDAAYRAASIKATHQGFVLGRFSKEAA